MLAPVVPSGLAPECLPSLVTTASDAMPTATPKPFSMTFPAVSAGAKSLASARRTLLEAEAAEFHAHVQECADCVFTAMRADIESGALPLPLHDPKRVEEELYGRATRQAHDSWYARSFDNTSLAVLLLADTISRYRSNLSLSEIDYADAMLLSLKGIGRFGTTRAAVVLHSGEQHPCAEVGLGVSVDWQKASVLVLRDLILTALWGYESARFELKLNRTKGEKDRRSPLWIGETPAINTESSQAKRRRSRL